MKGLSQRITRFDTFKEQTHQQASCCTSHSRGCGFRCVDVVLTGRTARLCHFKAVFCYCFASSSKTDAGSHICVLLLVSHTWAAISSGTTLPPRISMDLSARLSHGFWTQTRNLLGHNYLWGLLSHPARSSLPVGLWSSSQLLALQTLGHCRKEHLRKVGRRTSLAFTLRGQWKFVAAVFLLSLLNFTFSGHHTSGCTHGSPRFRL